MFRLFGRMRAGTAKRRATPEVPDVRELRQRYPNRADLPALSYGTVRDYCDSVDHFPRLATHNSDLKDAQRPWMVKAILNTVRPGGRLLEVGSGEPLAASVLAALGYEVTVCDPFDGSGNGPVEYETFRLQYPRVRFIRARFVPAVAQQFRGRFDCIFSISVLEHVPTEALAELFDAVGMALAPGGCSIHAIDHVLEGQADKYHENQVYQIVRLQEQLAGTGGDDQAVHRQVHTAFAQARADVETFYLSPYGHNSWRGATPYEAFPFRKCISIQSVARAPAA